MYAYATRLMEEGGCDEASLRSAIQALCASVTALRAAGPELASPGFEFGTSVDLPTAQRSLARAHARLAACVANIDVMDGETDVQLLQALITSGAPVTEVHIRGGTSRCRGI